jgi:hypothetical protein
MLARRSAIERGTFVPYPCSHVGIRCKHPQYQLSGILEYSASALGQLVQDLLRVRPKGAVSWITKKFIHNSNSYIQRGRPTISVACLGDLIVKDVHF